MSTTSVTTSTTSAYTVSSGNTLEVFNGGNVTGANIKNGGFLVVNGGVESNAVVSAGATETVSTGSASGDQIYGTLSTVSPSSASLTNEVVESGGKFFEYNSAVVTNTEVLAGGTFFLSGNTSGTNSNTTLVSGGTLELETAKATIGGALTFSGGSNTLEVSATISAGYGDQAVISGFSTTDSIDMVTLVSSTALSLSVTTSGGNTVAEVVSGGTVVDTFEFSGTSTYTSSTLSLAADSAGHAEIKYGSASSSMSGGTTSVTTSTAAGAFTETSGNTLLVLGGGSVSAATIDNGAFLVVNGGTDKAAVVSSGGTETISAGTASGDQIYGATTVNGGTVTQETVLNGGLLTVAAGASESSATISAGGSETVLGSASGDAIYGTQLVSAATAVVIGETVYNGGSLDLFLKGAIASGTIVSSGGELNISGNAFASNTVLSGGGILDMESPKAEVMGTLVFAGGGNTLEITDTTSAGYGDFAVNSGFSSTDKIDMTSAAFTGSALTLSQTVSGGNTVVDVISGGATVVETFTFAGTGGGSFELLTDGNGGVDLELLPVSVTTSVTTSTAPGAYTETDTNTLLVLGGGSVSAATIESGGFLVVNGGSDTAATIATGGQETVSAGTATGDQIYGIANDNGGTVSGETVLGGGQLNIGAGASASNVVLNGSGVVDLASVTAALSGSLTFAGGGNTLEDGAIGNTGYGDQAVISGFSSSDKIDVTGISLTGATLSFTTNANGNEVATISGTGGSESFIFSDPATYNSGSMSLIKDGNGGVDLILDTTPAIAFTSEAGQTNSATQIVNGTVNTTLDPEAIGSTVSVSEGNTVVGTATVGANGQWSADVAFLNDDGTNTLIASDTDAAGNTGVTSQSLTYNVNTTAAAFTPGNLVISISGDGDGSGQYADNAASPVTLEQITTSGNIVSQIVLPQTTTVVNGVTEYAISSEYGSQSEGSLELSADGHSLVIAGYGVNAQAFNEGGAAVYGNSALGQSTSVPGGPYTVVPRVVADINADGVIDTSTALDNVFNENNPRSVATVDGTSFYLSGQGIKGDTTQGVFYATDGASSATTINDATDTRTAEIYNGQLYVSADSTQGGGTTNISDYGSLPTSATSPTVLTGLSSSIVLTSANANTANASDIGQTVNLSPENFFFANADTLYVADSGNPKEGGIGDGGLQKWVFNGSQWTLQYTLSDGLNLVPGTAASGTSGLIGLTGEVVGNSVELYATSYNLTDIEPTYVYAITDSLNSTTGSGESFSTILTAAPGENIRGIAFAPTPYTPTITGTAAGQTTTSEAAIAPFSAVTVGDLNSNAVDTLTITLSGGGTLADGAGFTGTSSLAGSNGSYMLSGTAAAITNELDQLSFTPVNGVPDSSVSTTFTLSDSSTAGTASASDSTTTVTDTDPALAVTIGGTAQEGQTLTATANSSVNSYQWEVLINGVWNNINGATASTLVVPEADTGRQIRVVVGDAAGFSATSAATNAILDANGNQPVYETDTGSVIGDGHYQYVYGTATDTTVDSGGEQDVTQSGTAIGATVNSGGMQLDWGTASGTALDGGKQYVYGTATDTVVAAGEEVVESTGSANGSTIDSGTSQIVYAGGSVSGTAVEGGTQYIYGATSVDQTTIDNGGVQYLYGTATNTIVNSGGEQDVTSTGNIVGTATGTTVNAGGFQIDWGVAVNTVLDGGNQYVYGTASGTTISAGNQDIESGGQAIGTTIDSGGVQNVYEGGSATSTTVSGGGQYVYGTTVDQTTIDSGGVQYLYGSATNTTINGGGEQNVYAAGTDSSATINAGGVQIDWGNADNATLSGGTQFVVGTATGTTIDAGTQYVESGGTASATTINSGGTEHVYGGGTANGVTFGAASATLVMDQADGLAGAISGFQSGDSIDLSFIDFNSTAGATLGYSANAGNTGGTLTVTDGTNAASLALLGQYSAANFVLSSDGQGGTLISEQQVQAQSQLASAHA